MQLKSLAAIVSALVIGANTISVSPSIAFKRDTDYIVLENIIEANKNPALVDKWIDIKTTPEDTRFIIYKSDLDTLRTIDAKKDSNKSLLKRIFKDKYVKNNCTSIIGQRNRNERAFIIADALKDELFRPFMQHNNPPELAFVVFTETFFTNVRSSAKAEGHYQIVHGSHGSLRIDKYIDERRSLIKASERAAEFMAAGNVVFGNSLFAATSYIQGFYGLAFNLERLLATQIIPSIESDNIVEKNTKKLDKILLFQRSSQLFESYSDIVKLHQQNDLKILDKDGFLTVYQRIKPTDWRMTTKGLPEELIEQQKDLVYRKYLQDVTGRFIDIVDIRKAEEAYEGKYIRSFWDYHGLKEDLIKKYWEYNEFLSKIGKFDTPNYSPQMLAIAKIYYTREKYGFEKNSQKKLAITRDTLEQDMKFSDIFGEIDPRDTLTERTFYTILLNEHIKGVPTVNNVVPGNTLTYANRKFNDIIVRKGTEVFIPN